MMKPTLFLRVAQHSRSSTLSCIPLAGFSERLPPGPLLLLFKP